MMDLKTTLSQLVIPPQIYWRRPKQLAKKLKVSLTTRIELELIHSYSYTRTYIHKPINHLFKKLAKCTKSKKNKKLITYWHKPRLKQRKKLKQALIKQQEVTS